MDDYPPSLKPVWQHVAKELFALFASGIIYPFGVKASPERTRRVAQQRTVVLVHGYLANRSTLFPLANYLKMRGVKQILTFSYRTSEGVEQGAIRLKRYLALHVRGGRIDLVCHSMGGLVARVYLESLGGSRRVDRCITLGTPHRGTYGAYWIPSRAGRELRPGSKLLKNLERSKGNASRVSFTSIVAGADAVVIPRIFAANEETIHLQEVGHLSMLFSPEVFSVVAERLKNL